MLLQKKGHIFSLNLICALYSCVASSLSRDIKYHILTGERAADEMFCSLHKSSLFVHIFHGPSNYLLTL